MCRHLIHLLNIIQYIDIYSINITTTIILITNIYNNYQYRNKNNILL